MSHGDVMLYELVDLAAYRAAKEEVAKREARRARREARSAFSFENYIVADTDQFEVFVPVWKLRQNGLLRQPKPQLILAVNNNIYG